MDLSRIFRVKKTMLTYYLKDEYSLFYLHWIESARTDFDWFSASQSPKWRAWSGIAFETICLKHVQQIKQALGIQNVRSSNSIWSYQPKNDDEDGAQIDLVIDRKDDCVNLCEIKFTESPFVVNKSVAKELRSKRAVFSSATKSKKALFTTLISLEGLKRNQWSDEAVQASIDGEFLFL